jgi:protein AaeX
MAYDVDLLGAFVPVIIVCCVASLVIFVGANALLTKMGFYRLCWHPPLVRFSLFVILFYSVGLMLSIL